MFELETVERSIGPENGIVRRGWMLNPSSVLRTETSSQRRALAAQFGSGRSTRSPVSCVESATVSRLVGVGWPADVPAKAAAGNDERLEAVRAQIS